MRGAHYEYMLRVKQCNGLRCWQRPACGPNFPLGEDKANLILYAARGGRQRERAVSVETTSTVDYTLAHLAEERRLRVVEICAGAGGQSAGLEAAGFDLAAAVEIDHHACATLRLNRSHWKIIEGSVTEVSGAEFRGVDLLAGGVPRPPFSIAGKPSDRGLTSCSVQTSRAEI